MPVVLIEVILIEADGVAIADVPLRDEIEPVSVLLSNLARNDLLDDLCVAGKVSVTMANISLLKNGKVKAIRLSTLGAICRALECQPGDILEYAE